MEVGGQVTETSALVSTGRLDPAKECLRFPCHPMGLISFLGKSGINWKGGCGWLQKEVENFPWVHRDSITALGSPGGFQSSEMGTHFQLWGNGQNPKGSDHSSLLQLSGETKPVQCPSPSHSLWAATATIPNTDLTIIENLVKTLTEAISYLPSTKRTSPGHVPLSSWNF